MSGFWNDLKHGGRVLLKTPGFALAAIVVLALGIGANTAIFGIVNGVLLRPLPYADPDRLVQLWHTPPQKEFPGVTRFALSAANYLDWERQNTVFSSSAVYRFWQFRLTGNGEPQILRAARVEPTFFSVLGARPVIGRAIDPADDVPERQHVVVLSHGLWNAQFAGDAQQFPFHFLPYQSASFLDGSLAHLPWLQELPDPITSAMWCQWVEINPKTAAPLGIRQGDVVEITSPQGSLRAAAFVSPGLAPNVIAMPVGQGHRMFTRVASGRGENPIAILAPVTEPETGTLAWAATRVKIARVGNADGRLILFGAELRERGEEKR